SRLSKVEAQGDGPYVAGKAVDLDIRVVVGVGVLRDQRGGGTQQVAQADDGVRLLVFARQQEQRILAAILALLVGKGAEGGEAEEEARLAAHAQAGEVVAQMRNAVVLHLL